MADGQARLSVGRKLVNRPSYSHQELLQRVILDDGDLTPVRGLNSVDTLVRDLALKLEIARNLHVLSGRRA